MNSLIPLAFDPRQLRRATGLILALWTLAVAASVVWNVHLLHNAMLDAAERDARNSFDRDRLYLLNPNNMTREAHELKAQEEGTLGHITSLKPLRRENTPDAWEAAALRSFEQGRTEASSREMYQGQPYLRFMKPLVTEAVCLKCHAAQGYHQGDIRGGISVAVPLDPYLDLAQAQFGHIAGTHAGLWSLGLLGIFLGGRQMRQRLDKQLQAEEALRRSETKFRTLYDSTRDAVMLLDTKGFFDCNQATLAMFGCATREEFCSKHPADVSPPVQPDGTDSRTRASQRIAAALEKGSDHFEWMHKRANTGEIFPAEVLFSAMELDGKPVLQAVVRDITARKQSEAERDQLIQDLHDALANVKSLSGLLPICAGCKKIRDDQGYWSQVESYIQKHSEAKFSHGLCPDCLKKLYPDLVEAGLGDPTKKAP
jgi:PAS domain S-box-containing protein